MTIGVLPDDVLLEIFDFYLGKDNADECHYGHDYDGWQTLVHVCRRWRCIVFASPHRLDLRLYCTRQRSVNSKTLDIWPALPIVIFAGGVVSKEGVTNIIAALRQHNRVCKIYYCNDQFGDSSWKEFAATDEPFPALTSLKLFAFGQNVPVLPDSFLGGYAPRLRLLHMDGIPYPSIGKLVSSTTNLVRIFLRRIPHSGYIAPETVVRCLSMSPRLKSLVLGFQHPRFRAHRANQHPPSLTRAVFHNLTFLDLHGTVEYLEDILSQIETPILNEGYFRFFNRLTFDTPLLGQFICRTEAFRSFRTARIQFSSSTVGATLAGRGETVHNGENTLHLEITCKPLDRQLSALTQILNSFLSSLSTLKTLEITVSNRDWQDEVEVIRLREFFRPFTSVEKLVLQSKDSVRLVVPVLQGLAGESATEVLPSLRKLNLMPYDQQLSGPAKETIRQFITTRQLYGHPVSVYNLGYQK